jgi:hypothetical protein
MTQATASALPPRPDFRARLTRRLQRSDPFLKRAVQAAAVIGAVIGLLLYGWQAVNTDAQAARRALAQAATAGQLAAESDLARIDAAARGAAPLITAALAQGASPEEIRRLRAGIAAMLADTPVTAIVIFDGRGQALSVFGDLPSDAAGRVAPRRMNQRAGGELLPLELAPVSAQRAARYLDLSAGKGPKLDAALVLRTGAFQGALGAGSAAGDGWRAALLNRDGETVVPAFAAGRAFGLAETSLAAEALGWTPLHADESAAAGRVTGEAGDVFVETRAVAGNALQLVYVGEVRPAFSILASRRFELIALLGSVALAAALAISVIQNEWQRHDRHVRDADLMALRADVTCDLLSAGVIDWSVADGGVDYSEGWADLFAQGVEPASEQIFDWIARIHPDDRLGAREAYQSMLDGHMTELVHRVRVRLSSGLWVQVAERGRAIAGIGGEVKRIVLVQTVEPVDGSALRGAFDGARRADAVAV